MFNLLAVSVLERLHGRKQAVLLAELSGTTERTWRNRLRHGWEPTADALAELNNRTTATLIDKMVRDKGWPADEAREVLAARPSQKAGIALPTAELIYVFSPNCAQDCQDAIAVASHFDRECWRLTDAARSNDPDAVRDVLTSMLNWVLSFCPDGAKETDVELLRERFGSGDSVSALLRSAIPLADALILHVMSTWDLEFCASYFERSMQPHPLFELVMPRLAPDVTVEPETGRLLRNGRQPRQRWLEPAMSRLIDFVSVLVAWKRTRRLPDRLPRLKDLAAWCNEDETRLVSWRDGTTRFTSRHLERIWLAALDNIEGRFPGIPWPMFVCAHLWGPLMVRDDGHNTTLIDCKAHYKTWWERNRERLVGKGLQFGDRPWPDYLTSQGSGGLSPSSRRASQSSGRSSQPRDCQ